MKKSVSSPTLRLLMGLAVTLAAVAVFSLYALRQIDGLKALQTRTVDRNRRDSLQLLRIQNDLNTLGLAMRDMLDGSEPYPLDAWQGQFRRLRGDLEDALQREAQLAPGGAGTDRQRYLAGSLADFWSSADRVFAAAREGHAAEAREMVRGTLQARQAALTAAVARLLAQNNETEEQAVTQIQGIYRRVERDIYVFLGAMLLAISLTSLSLIYSNRRIFESLALLSAQKSELARKLIAVQEEALRSIARELHDEFGQILTAIGAMLRRAERHGLPPESPFRAELQEVREVTQATLEKVRSLSQALHPNILDDGGLEKALDWYLPVFEKQTGIQVRYEKEGPIPVIADRIAIHVYRVVQEALNNLARHSHSPLAWVRLRSTPGVLDLEVEDRGVGIPSEGGSRGIGLVAMRERAELVRGTIEFLRPAEGGTLVRLNVPLQETEAYEKQ